MATWNATDLLGARIDEVDTTKKFDFGQKCTARHISSGYIGEFVYMQGVASNAEGYFCLLNHDNGVVSLLADGDIGPVGVSRGAIVASTFGWFQVSGKASGFLAASVADNAGLYATSSAGVAGATASGKSEIANARAAAASGSSAALTEVELGAYPHVGLVSGSYA